MKKTKPKEPYRLRIRLGHYAGDYWDFESIDELKSWLQKKRHHPIHMQLMEPGTLEIVEKLGGRRFKVLELL